MAEIANLGSRVDLKNMLQGMTLGELTAQQIAQQGAIHAVTFLLTSGCSEALAIEMMASLRANMVVITDIARSKGFDVLFPDTPPNFN